jgi:hypothetical protein
MDHADLWKRLATNAMAAIYASAVSMSRIIRCNSGGWPIEFWDFVNIQTLEALMNPHGKGQTAGGACFCCQCTLQDVSDFLLHGQTVACSPKAQTGFKLIVQISNGDALLISRPLI